MSGLFGPAAPARYEAMDRGTEALNARLKGCHEVEVRQTLRGWFQQWMCGCEARNEFKYYANGRQVGYSLEESVWCARIFCQPCYSWTMPIRDVATRTELLTVHRPCSCPLSPFKCCCFQSATVSSGGHHMGRVRENCYCCIPSFSVFNESNRHVYTIHPPTCCCGTTVNCCAEGCPCSPRACCRVPFWIYPAGQLFTDGPMAHRVGKIVKKRKNLLVELFTDANAFEVELPPSATTSEKAVLVGTSIFFNSLFFEEKPADEVDQIDSGASCLDCV
jgi:Scramblase